MCAPLINVTLRLISRTHAVVMSDFAIVIIIMYDVNRPSIVSIAMKTLLENADNY